MPLPLMVLAFLVACNPLKEDAPPDDTAVGSPVDADGDGFVAAEDCDDDDPGISPGAVETCDGVDNDCDGEIDEPGADGSPTWYPDADGDGWGDEDEGKEWCDAPFGWISRGGGLQ